MAEKVKRTKTKYANIYLNENTKKYDIKYNYKVYNTDTKRNDYDSVTLLGKYLEKNGKETPLCSII